MLSQQHCMHHNIATLESQAPSTLKVLSVGLESQLSSIPHTVVPLESQAQPTLGNKLSAQ